MKLSKKFLLGSAVAAGCVVFGAGDAGASSHREAPFVTKNPKIDSTDFYMFNSYETGRDAYMTVLANYQPFQENFGGPNYYEMDPEALYEILLDNNGDGKEDMTFQFRFHHALANSGNGLALDITLNDSNNQPVKKTNGVPLLNIGGISAADTSKLNVSETYDVTFVAGDRRTGTATQIVNSQAKPVDFIGTTTFGSAANYETYAMSYVAALNIPGCDTPGKVWVGQRREPFAVNVGAIFDLVGAPGLAATIEGGTDRAGRGFDASNPFNTGILYNKAVTTLALELPIACVKGTGSGIIGGWTAASMRQARVLNPNANYTTPSKEGGAWTQVSHLGMPLVNEVVIGLKDKDTFSAVSPIDTSKVADYVTNPTLPALLEVLYGTLDTRVKAPSVVRTDLVGVFATGLTATQPDGTQVNVNQTSTGPGNPGPTGNTLPAGIFEYLRLNTALGHKTQAEQEAVQDVEGLGALGCFNDARQLVLTQTGCDPTGFPNGRRPGDDVTDIALRVVMGALFADDTIAPARNIAFTDGNYNGPEQFNATFPYLRTPLAGNVDPNVDPDTISQK